MKKLYWTYALAVVAFVACTSDEVSVVEHNDTVEPVAITFGAGSNRVHTRADLVGSAAAAALSNYFHVYGIKTVGGTAKTVYPDYVVEYDGRDGAGAAHSTASNSHGWEYVGLLSYPSQILHYWDYSADNFIFQAWSPTVGNATVTVDSPRSLTISAPTSQDLAQLYLADLVEVTKGATGTTNTFGGTVTFTFRNMSTKVRLGIYETVPGYSVSEITFRSAGGNFANSNSNALLDGTFNAADFATGGTYHVTYNATTGRAELDHVAPASSTLAGYFDFGTFDQGIIGTESTTPTWAGGSSAYRSVLPNEDHAADMTLYVDFTLTANDGSNDVLYVKGATATVPQSFMVWHPNYAYTYLFKITKDVNGTTGDEGVDPTKLYPITFDAVVKEEVEVTASEFELKD